MNIQNKETTEGLSYLAIAERLYAAGIGDTDTCKYEAAILLEHFCGVHRAMLPLRKTELFSSDELLEAVNQRCDHYPLQYLIGRTDSIWYGLVSLAAPLFFVPTYALWRLGVRKYKSAGS